MEVSSKRSKSRKTNPSFVFGFPLPPLMGFSSPPSLTSMIRCLGPCFPASFRLMSLGDARLGSLQHDQANDMM